MKRIVILLFFFSFLYYSGNADPITDIVGPTFTQVGDIDPYTIAPIIGSSYIWAVTGGEIIAGQGTPLITVHWDSSNPGSISVNIDNGADIVIIDTNSSKN